MAEYMASGRPVVTTDVGEMGRLLTDGENALLGRAGDAEDYGAKICALLADRRFSVEVGAAGREYAREHFGYRAYGRPLLELYAEASRGMRGGPGAASRSAGGDSRPG